MLKQATLHGLGLIQSKMNENEEWALNTIITEIEEKKFGAGSKHILYSHIFLLYVHEFMLINPWTTKSWTAPWSCRFSLDIYFILFLFSQRNNEAVIHVNCINTFRCSAVFFSSYYQLYLTNINFFSEDKHLILVFGSW